MAILPPSHSITAPLLGCVCDQVLSSDLMNALCIKASSSWVFICVVRAVDLLIILGLHLHQRQEAIDQQQTVQKDKNGSLIRCI